MAMDPQTLARKLGRLEGLAVAVADYLDHLEAAEPGLPGRYAADLRRAANAGDGAGPEGPIADVSTHDEPEVSP